MTRGEGGVQCRSGRELEALRASVCGWTGVVGGCTAGVRLVFEAGGEWSGSPNPSLGSLIPTLPMPISTVGEAGGLEAGGWGG